jgi:hypothetical protein
MKSLLKERKMKKVEKIKRVSAIISVVLLSGFLGYKFGSASLGLFKAVIEPGSMVTEASYVIFQDDYGNVYARNGLTGEIEFSGTDASTVIQSAIDAGTGEIFVKKGTYTLNTQLQLKAWSQTLRFEAGTILKFGGSGYAIDMNSQSYAKILGYPEIYLTSATPDGGIRVGTSIHGSLIEVQRIHADTITEGQVGIKLERVDDGTGYCYLNKIVAFDFWNLDIGIDIETGANANDVEFIGSTGRTINTWIQIAGHDNRIKLFAASGKDGLKLTGFPLANTGFIYFEGSGTGITFAGQNNVFEMTYLSGTATSPTQPTGGNEVYIHNEGWRSSKRNSGTATIPAGQTSVIFKHGLASIPSTVTLGPKGSLQGLRWDANETHIILSVDVTPSQDTEVSWYAEV